MTIFFAKLAASSLFMLLICFAVGLSSKTHSYPYTVAARAAMVCIYLLIMSMIAAIWSL